MGLSENNSHLPPALRGTKLGTFVYITIKDRWPTIVSKLVNHFHTLHRQFVEIYGEEAEHDVKNMLAHLSEMRYQMMTNKPLELLTDKYDDVKSWNKLIQKKVDEGGESGKKVTWYDTEWLFVECYLYRRIFGVMNSSSTAMKTYDYFRDQKREGFQHHRNQIIDSLLQLQSHLTVSSCPEADDIHLSSLIKQCIWGNRCDLSLSAGEAAIHDQNAEALAAMDHLLIVNDLPKTLYHFRKMRNKSGRTRRIDIILDNAGMELVSDMIFAEFVLASNMVDEVYFHMKQIPWFVSDVTMEDWEWTIEAFEKLESDLGPRFGRFLEKRVKEGTIKLRHDLFWTSSHPFCDMQTVAPELYDDLSNSRLLIFKGDLNYRKLVGDREWPYTTPFKTALQGFHPAPLLALRTLKAETIAGLSNLTVNSLLSHFKDNNEWLVTGTHAVIQFSE